jgi:hypothetical protein
LRRLLIVILSLLTVVAIACDGVQPSGSGSAQGGVGGGIGGAGGNGLGAGGMPPVTFEDDVRPLLLARCGAALTDCHAREVYRPDVMSGCRSRISFEDASLGATLHGPPNAGSTTGCPDRTLLERLLEGEVEQCGGATRYVVPCSPDDSYLARKVAGGPYCNDASGSPSSAMPPGVPLDDASRDRLLDWIRQGARHANAPAGLCTPP